MKNFTKLFLFLISTVSFTVVLNAQTTGTVFRDFNGNGTRENTSGTFVEPVVPGIIVNAYNSTDVLVASYTTTSTGTFSIPLTGSTYNGTPGSNTGSIANGTAVRLEFIVTTTCGLNPNIDFSSNSGNVYGSAVRFVNGGSTGNNYAINNPSEYVKPSINYYTYFYAIRHVYGDPTAAISGTATTRSVLEGLPYTANNNTVTTTTPATRTLAASFIGSSYGLAYSKKSGKLFTAAFIKRHSGLGPLGSGGIYMVDSSLSTGSVVNLFNLDANGYPTRSNSASGAPAFGAGTSYNAASATAISYLGSTDPVSGLPLGMGVIGTNIQRGLTNDATASNADPSAYGQVGIYGLGDIDASDDGSNLFVVNLYDRKLYKLTLNSATNPTAVSATSSYVLPNPPLRSTLGGGFATTYASDNSQFYDGTKGRLRPFALKYYRGKLYVGAVTTGEGAGAVSTTDNNAGNPEYTDLWAYVFEFDPATNTWAASPVLQFPLNFNRSTNSDGYDETFELWRNTSATTTFTWNTEARLFYAQAMFTDIEFDPADGSMIIGLRDRIGDQVGHFQRRFNNVGTDLEVATALGEVLRAYRTSSCTFQLETNGKEGSSSTKAATAGAGNGQGPGGGEFYYQDNVYDATDATPNATFHVNVTEGSLAILPGTEQIMVTTMDPNNTWEQGIDWFSNNTGADIRDHTMEMANANDNSTGYFGKGSGLGDIELLTYGVIEIGNRIWNDVNGNGIQDAGEAGISGVILELVDGSGNAVDSDPGTAGVQATFVTTDANGNWYLTSATGTDATGINYGVTLLPNTNYFVRLATSGTGNDWDPTANGGAGGPRAGGDLVNYQLTIADKMGSGAIDFSDNDATIISSIPQVSITTGDYGQNNHNIDFGFKQLASLGDKIWRDDDKDGIQDSGEPGVAGVTVTLYQNGTDGLPGTADDVLVGTTVTDAYGIYLFNNLSASTNAATSYNVGFTLPANYQFTTQTNTQVTGTSDATNTTTTSGGSTAANGSDASVTTGRTGSYWLAAGEAEKGADAGLIFSQPTTNSIGDRVWFDNGAGGGTASDGIQNGTEPGISGVTVTLYNNSGVVIATTVTDANGNYIFTGLADGNYRVGFTLPVGFNFTARGADNISGGAGDSNTDSDVNTSAGVNFGKTDVINLDAASAIAAGVNYTNVDAGLVQTAATTASLGDKVWNDLNSNGIQDAGEPGVAGVTVNLYRDSNNDGVISGSEATTPYATTVTDAFGNYIFNNLPAATGATGFYQVGFVAPSGYILTTANAGSDDLKDSDANTGTGLTGNYFLRAGERNLSVDAGLVQTSPAGTAKLGDRVWFDANSNGTQDAGETGVAGVTVTLYNNVGTAIATTTTDANGNYQFVNLAAGDYSVGFSNLPAGYSFTPIWSSNDANATNSDANPGTGRTGTINLTAGESEQDVDAGLIAGVPSGLGSLGNKVWWDIVTANNVQDAGEPGVPGVTVNLYRDANGDGLINGAEATTPFATTVTNALGEYIFTGLAAGTYQVGFTNLPTGSSTVTQNSGTNDSIDSDGSTVTNATGASVSTTGLYNLAAGEDNLTVDLGLINTTKGSLGNRVWFDNGTGGGTANDGIQNGSEAGVAGVMVTLVNAAGQPVDRAGNVLAAGASLITTTTDANGYYAFADLTAGVSFAVKFSNVPAGFDFATKAGVGGGDDSRSDPNLSSGLTPAVTIVANTFNSTLDAGITSSRAALGNYVWLDTDGDGVQDFDGTEPGVAGVTVTLYRPGFGLDGIASTADDALPVASMITDQNGLYLFSNLVAGTYEVEFSTIPSGLSFTKQNTPGDNSDNTNSDAVPVTGNTSVGRTGGIVLSAGEMDLTVDAGLFKPRAVIGNFVWADKNANGIQDAGEPGVAGIVVTLFDGGGNPVAVAITDANGGYLFPNVAPGTYSISFTNLPNATSFTTPNQTGGGGNDNNDSDVIGTTVTGIIVTTTTVDLSFDAGIIGVITLPARLEFTALKQGNTAKLIWKVTFEENVARYELEYSADGITYTAINNQNRNGSAEYQYLDVQPASGINYYRVRIVDIDGRITYSEVRTVLFGKGGQILVFPNPVRTADKINIQLPDSWQNKKIIIEIMNQLGQVISIQNRQQASQVEKVAISRLSEGSYILRMSSVNGEVETRKILVKR